MTTCSNPDCGAPLPPSIQHRRFCSDRCRNAAWRRTHRHHSADTRPRLACGCVDTGLRSHKGTPICLRHRNQERRARLREGVVYTASSGQKMLS